MYIAQHEESMMQESFRGDESIQKKDAHEGTERHATLDSPARHIGPREYIEQIILSNKQEDLRKKEMLLNQHMAAGGNMRFEENESIVKNDAPYVDGNMD